MASAQQILANIKNQRIAEATLAARNPALLRLYTTLVQNRFHAIAGARNEFLVKAVPFLYRAVAPQCVLELVGHFYDCNRALFHDGRERHLAEARSLLDGLHRISTRSQRMNVRSTKY